MLFFYQVATRFSMTFCSQIVEQIAASQLKPPRLLQVVNKTDKLSTSWEEALRTQPDIGLLQQHLVRV